MLVTFHLVLDDIFTALHTNSQKHESQCCDSTTQLETAEEEMYVGSLKTSTVGSVPECDSYFDIYLSVTLIVCMLDCPVHCAREQSTCSAARSQLVYCTLFMFNVVCMFSGHVRASVLLDCGTYQWHNRGEKLWCQNSREEHSHRGAGHLRFWDFPEQQVWIRRDTAPI